MPDHTVSERLRKRKFGGGKKNFRNFLRDIGKLPQIEREGRARTKKDIEEFKKRQKK